MCRDNRVRIKEPYQNESEGLVIWPSKKERGYVLQIVEDKESSEILLHYMNFNKYYIFIIP